MAIPTRTLLRPTTCPHCWAKFEPQDILWISSHSDLLGDPRLGPEQPQRFLPTRFNLQGYALDSRGFVCQSLACPKCHLPVPRVLLETEPTFLSILGTPACGKSFFLTALTWELRRLLPTHFGLSFADADTLSNRSLNEYEESLFLNPKADELVPLADLIRKTELQGELYNTVMYGNQNVSYPRPFLFTVQPLEHHPYAIQAPRVARVLCLYDNAGEHFLTGQDSTASPVTRHMARASILFYLFDPTQDPRFQKLIRQNKPALAGAPSSRTSRQEVVLQEAAGRVRRVLGLSQGAKHTRPLIVVLTKYDVWAHLLPEADCAEPWVIKENLAGLDLERIENRSREVRALLLQVSPELVAAAEGFAEEVIYVPTSALGESPTLGEQGKGLAIKPAAIKPIWATVPFLYGMCRWMPGLIPSRKRRQGQDSSADGRGVAGRLQPLDGFAT
ncbi:MAG TPA: hypothetical protein VK395_03480 [Gemmataceae bacterium]|nr:hypothetical protein [Gemmataceae bacterium]